MAMMILSGWGIYNASPLFPFSFPRPITLGGWLAGSIAWHLAAMWLLVVNGLAYVAYGLLKGHFVRRFLPLTPRLVGSDASAAFRVSFATDPEPTTPSNERRMWAFSYWASSWCFRA